MYWCAASTKEGDGNIMEAKWLSIGNHIHNRHRGHGQLFPKCLHKTLKHRKLLKARKCACEMLLLTCLLADTEVSEKLVKIISDSRLCAAIKQLSPIHQTSNIEAFHSVVIHFAPKHMAFSYEGMEARYVMKPWFLILQFD